ncbi:hypothetical protein CEXT_556171 [Caerostris extrusa]|uniref:Uncharacterized protein n=1 Tax=Caerostris extrusa TaxID=172846 RepID=A0AAV4RQZ2_CAEEX|nr:hypothetical protein CEXT_556171 [Caerostris extrusa]
MLMKKEDDKETLWKVDNFEDQRKSLQKSSRPSTECPNDLNAFCIQAVLYLFADFAVNGMKLIPVRQNSVNPVLDGSYYSSSTVLKESFQAENAGEIENLLNSFNSNRNEGHRKVIEYIVEKPDLQTSVSANDASMNNENWEHMAVGSEQNIREVHRSIRKAGMPPGTPRRRLPGRSPTKHRLHGGPVSSNEDDNKKIPTWT